ncbi:flagellar biosynthetic protein FliR [Hyalangium rubrum]|uniref:Flagellar biosynthetic protein FliR n=1 Tax=Hyalangium rubrum TaxID=3103134 RepID=A0ABU5GWG1_9BACT|nr:flagellar biosynthetic protein FliR [Hyalangium sp. s54d21]MDY7225528.1 flagellar biosynthetic protein FliR [Hyalangium sp. s54d21]
MNVSDVLSQLRAETNLSLVIFTVGLLMCRVMPVLIFSPFLGGEVVPTEVKMGVGITLAIVMFPAVSGTMGALPTTALPYIALLLKEIFIGVTLAFIVNVVFDAARVAGTLADTMAGSNNAQLYVPQLGQQVSLLSSLKVQLAVVLFLTLNGHHIVIEALADSLVAIPLDKFPQFSGGVWPFFDLMIRVFADLLAISLALAAPIMLATFLTDLALGAINRVAPQIQVFFISMAIKPLVGVIVAAIALPLLMGRFQREFVSMLASLKQALRILT